MNDDFVSIEHIILAIFKSKSKVAQILKDQGVTEKDLVTAITELRKGERVTSSSAEETYNALNKYGKNLNDLAQKGKLDPVVPLANFPDPAEGALNAHRIVEFLNNPDGNLATNDGISILFGNTQKIGALGYQDPNRNSPTLKNDGAEDALGIERESSASKSLVFFKKARISESSIFSGSDHSGRVKRPCNQLESNTRDVRICRTAVPQVLFTVFQLC